MNAADVSEIPLVVRLERAGCPMGCLSGETPVLTARDRLHDLPGNFVVVRCNTCGLMRTDPRPDGATIGFYYPGEYAPHNASFAMPRPKPQKPLTLRRRLRATLRRWRGRGDPRELPLSPPGRLFEVGAATGQFLAQATSRGWQASGVEMSMQAVEAGRRLGLHITPGTIESIPPPETPFDIVVGWMVFEHVHRPQEVFHRLHEFVRRDGWLAFSVPDASAAEFRWFGRRWYALQVPCHMTHFTPRTVAALLERTGWQVERIIWHANPNNLLQSLRYCALDRGYQRLADWLAEIIADRKARRFRRWLGQLLAILRQSGRMTIWARRRSDEEIHPGSDPTPDQR